MHTVHVQLVTDQAKAASLKHQSDDLHSQLVEVSRKITVTQGQISQTTAAIRNTESDIKRQTGNLQSTRESLQTEQKGLDGILLYVEQEGPIGYLTVLLQVRSFSDFVSRITLVSEVATYERSVVHNLDTLAQSIHVDIDKLNKTQATLRSQQQSLLDQQSQLKTVAAQRTSVLQSIQSEQHQVALVESDLRGQGQKLWDAIQQLKQEIADGHLTGAQIFSIVKAISAIYGIDPLLVMAVIREESGGNAKAVSSAGAQGLMQLMPQTAADLGVTDAFNPQQNVRGGIAYLAYLLKLFSGNVEFALAAYNAGPGAVEHYNGIPPYPETQNYVRNIMAMYKEGI